MTRHIVKFTHQDGVELSKNIYWCGRESQIKSEWAFLDSQHAALSINGRIVPCKSCVKAVIKNLEEWL